MTNFPFYSFKEYLPVRYTATILQESDRQLCYDFKDGCLNNEVKQLFLNKIKEIADNKTNVEVCFIPASTYNKTASRYKKLANAINEEGFNANTKAIFNIYDNKVEDTTSNTNYTIGSFGFNEELIRGKNIILIDDIITRGVTFNQVAEHLMSLGACSVFGLFLAKKINPDYNTSNSFCPEDFEDDEEPDYYVEDYFDEEETYEQYSGSYAQDVEGYSDQDIDDIFDGDPDAYWNID